MKKRDKMIIAAFERSINLNVRIVRSKKEFNRKRLKQEIKKVKLKRRKNMSFTLRISGTAFEQKLVGFKDIKTFKEKLKNQNDEFFYEILDEEPEDAKEISHQYVVSANSEIVLLDKDRDVVKTFEVSDLRRMTPVDNLDTEKLSYKGYALAIGEEEGFSETYKVPSKIKDFNIAYLYCYTTKFDETIDTRSLTEDAMQSGQLFYISDNELKKLCSEEIDLLRKTIADYEDNQFDSYDPAELLATLIDLGSESISKYELTYNEDGGCSNRTISGYFLDQKFNEVD